MASRFLKTNKMKKEELIRLKKQNRELIIALKDADYFLQKHVDGYNLDNPKYWSITKVLRDNGVNQNKFTTK